MVRYTPDHKFLLAKRIFLYKNENIFDKVKV